jgi:glycerophosphoryl diester phosphodiesterase
MPAHAGGAGTRTVNDPRIMQRVIDPGVDGIVTDDPHLLVGGAIRNGPR